MAKARTTDRLEQRERTSPVQGTRMRIDRAHQPVSEADAAAARAEDSAVLAASGLAGDMSGEQVLAQAAQLAGNLQDRLRDLDRREAMINSNSAKIEAELRATRLWISEQEAAIYEREQELQQREEELKNLADSAAVEREAYERSFAAREQRVIQDENLIRQREENLQVRINALQEESADLENARRAAHGERVELEEQLREDYRRKCDVLDVAEAAIRAESAELQAKLEADRAAVEEQRAGLQQEFDLARAALEQQTAAERAGFQEQIRQERDALLHEIELCREDDQRRLDKHRMDLIGEVEAQRQELFEAREQLEKSRAIFEQERSVWVVAQTGGDPRAFDLAQERLQLEKDRAAFTADRRKHEGRHAELTILAENQQKEIDRLRGLLAQPAAGPSSALAGASHLLPPVAPQIPLGPSGGSLLEIAEQQARIDQATEYLEREAEEVDRRRVQLEQERLDWKRQYQEQRDELNRREQAVEQETESRRKKLVTREETLDQQLASVEQTRQEILRVHRESLEMRLVAEELWAQVAGRVPPAEVTQSIANLRSRLANQYRMENKQLATRKQQIVELTERLEQQQEAMARQRRELQAWAAARQLEIEQQAERLVGREVELEQQQQALKDQVQQLDVERRKLQHESRRLTSRDGAAA